MGIVYNHNVSGSADLAEHLVRGDDCSCDCDDRLSALELTAMERKIVALLPATADEIARALYNDASPSEMNCVYVHLHNIRSKGVSLAKRRVYSKARRRYVKQFYIREESGATGD